MCWELGTPFSSFIHGWDIEVIFVSGGGCVGLMHTHGTPPAPWRGQCKGGKRASALLCAKPTKGQGGTQGCAPFLPAALVMERSTLAFLCPTAAPYLDTAGPIGCCSSARSWGLAHSSDAAATQHPLHLPLLCNTCPELSISEAAASHPTAASARILPGVHPPLACQ